MSAEKKYVPPPEVALMSLLSGKTHGQIMQEQNESVKKPVRPVVQYVDEYGIPIPIRHFDPCADYDHL